MATDVGIKFGIQGDREFKTAVSGVNSEIKNLQSEMKLAVSEMAGMDNQEEKSARQLDILGRTMDATKDKAKLLEDQYNSQKDKLDDLAAALEETKNSENATTEEIMRAENAYNRQAKVVNDLGTQLNNTKASINDIETQMNSLGEETDETSDSFEKAEKSAFSFGSILKAEVIGEAVIKGVKDLANGLKDLAFGSSKYADEVLTTATVTGLSTDALQEYMYMSELVDVSVDTISGSLTKLTKSMSSAKGGTGAAADAFKQLGIAVTDENGELRNNQDVFNDLIDALGGIGNETEADALAMEILGKSANALKPIINVGSEGLKQFAEEAHEVGYVMDETALATNGAADDAFQRFDKTIEAVKNNIGTAFAPVLTEVLTTLTDVAKNLNDTTAVTGAIGDLITKGINFILENLPQFVATAVEVIRGFAEGLAEGIPELIPQVVNVITSLINTMIENLPGIISAAIKLAVGIGKGLVEAIPQILTSAKSIISELIKTLTDAAKQLIALGVTWGKDLIDNFVGGIKAKISAVKDTIKSVAQTVKDFIGFSEPKKGPLSDFHTFAPDMIDLWNEGVYKALPSLEGAINTIAATTSSTLTSSDIAGAVGSAVGGIQPVVNVVFGGDLAQLARVLQPAISAETNRLGRSLA